jgi:hypothetical protein
MYNFWDYFWGALVLLSWALPLLALVMFKVVFLIMTMMAAAVGFRPTSQDGKRVSVRVNAHDYDEDGY